MVWEIADAIVALGLFDGSAAPAGPVIQQNGVAAFSRLGVGTYRLELSQPQTPTTTLVLCQPAAGNFAVMSGSAQADGTILIEARDPRDASLVDVPTFLVEVVRAPQSADPTGALPVPIIPPVGVGSLQTAYNGGNTILETAADGQVTFASDAGDPVASALVLEGANTVNTLRIGGGASGTNILLGPTTPAGNFARIQAENAPAGSGANGPGITMRAGSGDGAGAGGFASIIGAPGGGGSAGGGALVSAGTGQGGGGTATLSGGGSIGPANAGNAVVAAGNVSGAGVGNGGDVRLTPGTGQGGGNPGYVRAERSALQFPNLTTVQRNALTGVPTGAQLWNTTTGQLEVWDGAAWVAPGGASSLQGAYNGGQSVDVTATDGPVVLTRDAGDPPDSVLRVVGDADFADNSTPGLLHFETTAVPWISRISTGSNGAGNAGTSLQIICGEGRGAANGGSLQFLGGAGDPDPAGTGEGGGVGLVGGPGPGGVGAGGIGTVSGGDGGATGGDGGNGTVAGGNAVVGEGGSASVLAGQSASGDGGEARVLGGQASGVGSGGPLELRAGSNVGGDGPGGAVLIRSGQGDGTGAGGNLTIEAQRGATDQGAGDVLITCVAAVGAASDGGDVRFVPGAASGTGDPGQVGMFPTSLAAAPDHAYDRADRHLASRTVLGTLGVAVVTTAERDALATPADTCLIVWNTTTGALEANPANTGWVAV